MRKINRREFAKTTALGSIGFGIAGKISSFYGKESASGKRIGIIGLDTSHSTAFSKALNADDAGSRYGGFRIVAAYPKGSNDIKSSVARIPEYTEQVKKYGVEIVNSIDELLTKVDFVCLETNDGRIHLEQAMPVLKAGKPMFIDKPMAASLADVIAIFNAADHYKVPVFSSSSLRYITGAKEISNGQVGKVIGADTYSPCSLEKTHPDFFWYGIHGVETLFTIMGKGCKSVTRVTSPDTDVAAGLWQDGRIGTFRGTRTGKATFGGVVYGEKGNVTLGEWTGYEPLLLKIVEFFTTGVVPVNKEDTIDIFAFMEAADESKKKGGVPVEIEKIKERAIQKAKKIK